ncbi:hypothetical protein P7C70_g4742, partial [Phenoliferia sp. Uapishka_3]
MPGKGDENPMEGSRPSSASSEPRTSASRQQVYEGQSSWPSAQENDSNLSYPPLPNFARAAIAPPYQGFAPHPRELNPQWGVGRRPNSYGTYWSDADNRDADRLPLGGIGGVEEEDWDRRPTPTPRQAVPYSYPYGRRQDNTEVRSPVIHQEPSSASANRPSSASEFLYRGLPFVPRSQPSPSDSPIFNFPATLPSASPPLSSSRPTLHQYPSHESTRRDRDQAEERPYQCDECPLAFHRGHDLKRHKRIHLEVKPFPCYGCEKRFTRKDALKRHLLVKQHDPPKPAVATKDDEPAEAGEEGASDPMPPACRPSEDGESLPQRPSINPLGGPRDSGLSSWSSSSSVSNPTSFTSDSPSDPSQIYPPTETLIRAAYPVTAGASSMQEALRRREKLLAVLSPPSPQPE